MLDTVNEHGGWQGSIGADQLAWLTGELVLAADRIVVLFSHHPLESLVNACHAPGRPGESSARSCATCSWATGASPCG